jgi:hypothetical protein
VVRPRIRVGAAFVLLGVALTECTGGTDFQAPDVATSADPAVAAAEAQLRDGVCTAAPAEPPELASNASGLTRTLEPLAADRLLICAYETRSELPTHPPERRLSQATVITDVAEIGEIGAALNGGTTLPHQCHGNCPAAFLHGSDQYLLFGDSTSIVTIRVRNYGPAYATNGQLTLSVTDTYYRTLETLLPGYAWCQVFPYCRTSYFGPDVTPPPSPWASSG